MKKLVQHIHQRRLRPLDYFRILDKQNRFQLDKETMKNNFRVFETARFFRSIFIDSDFSENRTHFEFHRDATDGKPNKSLVFRADAFSVKKPTKLRENSSKFSFFRHFNRLIKDHRSLHREIIIEENRNRQKIQEKNRRILETVVEHFPDIELLTKSEKHRDKIEALAKPRSSSVPSFSFKSSNRNGI